MKFLETFEVEVLLLLRKIAKILTEGDLFYNDLVRGEPSFLETIPPGVTGTPLAKYLLHSLDMMLSESNQNQFALGFI